MLDRIIKTELPNGLAEMFWQFTDIRYLKTDSIEMLYGKWLPNGAATPRSDGAGGTFWVKRIYRNINPVLPETINAIKNFNERKTVLADTFTCSNPLVSLAIYDNGEIDGDSISLYMNDIALVQKRALSLEPISLQLHLEKGQTYLLKLFAENLGTIPPNTALLKIIAGEMKKDFFISADLSTNSSVLIRVEE